MKTEELVKQLSQELQNMAKSSNNTNNSLKELKAITSGEGQLTTMAASFLSLYMNDIVTADELLMIHNNNEILLDHYQSTGMTVRTLLEKIKEYNTIHKL